MTVLMGRGRVVESEQADGAGGRPYAYRVRGAGRSGVVLWVGGWGWRLAASEVGALELVRVERWLADPVWRRVPAGVVLEAWNFFEDMVRGLGEGRRLPRQGAVHGGAYEKLFAGECGDWSPDERRAVRELLTAGVELWGSAS
ncbi:hypothetical protein [Streptomyces sp. CL12]|uniref:hypothetical protein n=1 Tax=Streptomyces sp. CL12 TaxID=3391744 RepID=UPI003A80464A